MRYQFYHSLGLLGIGLASDGLTIVAALRAAALLIVLGIVLFSGSLYALTLGAPQADWSGHAPRWAGIDRRLAGVRLRDLAVVN